MFCFFFFIFSSFAFDTFNTSSSLESFLLMSESMVSRFFCSSLDCFSSASILFISSSRSGPGLLSTSPHSKIVKTDQQSSTIWTHCRGHGRIKSA
uniref:Putative secreted protein ovary overexpressed n=1 Tax=Rhipicephalus microplus TaxID=6941 RepID=A0A6M2DA18_RHIMP